MAATASLAAFAVVAAPAAAKVRAPHAAQRPAAAPEDGRLLMLLRLHASREDSLDPLEVLYRDSKPDTSVFANLFTPALDAQRQVLLEQSQRALSGIDRASLTLERQWSYDAFAHELRHGVDRLDAAERAITAAVPISHFGSLHTELPGLFGGHARLPFVSADDYRRNLALLHAWPGVVGSIIARFREGMAKGITAHSAPVRNMIVQIDTILAVPLAESPFLDLVRSPDIALPSSVKSRLQQDYSSAVVTKVYPAYRRLRKFLAEDYLPQTRRSPGLVSIPGGSRLYRRLVEAETGQAITPAAVHALGLAEVARIQGEMAGVSRKLGFNGSLPAFFEHLRTDPRFHPKSAEELRAGYLAVARHVDAQLPRLFLRSPRSRLEIAPYPAWQQRFEAGGSYDQGSADGSRPGVFYFNTFDLPSRFLTGIVTLYLHEGVPGHHFQISLAKENQRLPAFQRAGNTAAYVEGWALYAETLGYEMGLYNDPMAHWGTLDDEMLRAMRLVVDTGLHDNGWSRDQAVAYMLTNSGMGRTDAEAEVDRYIARPAQALSYKLGALAIQRLRRRAEAALGGRFDLRQFHEQVLGSGVLPLPVLEAKLDHWITGQRAR